VVGLIMLIRIGSGRVVGGLHRVHILFVFSGHLVSKRLLDAIRPSATQFCIHAGSQMPTAVLVHRRFCALPIALFCGDICY